MRNSHRSLIAVAALGILSGPAIATADDGAKLGLIATGNLGAGHLFCSSNNDTDNCAGEDAVNSYSGTLGLGVLVTPRFAVFGSIGGAHNLDDNVSLYQVVATANARVWPVPRFYLEGGLGLAHSKLTVDAGFLQFEAKSETVPAVTGAAGVELVRTPSLAFDVSVRGTTGFYDDDYSLHQLSIGLGLTFFAH